MSTVDLAPHPGESVRPVRRPALLHGRRHLRGQGRVRAPAPRAGVAGRGGVLLPRLHRRPHPGGPWTAAPSVWSGSPCLWTPSGGTTSATGPTDPTKKRRGPSGPLFSSPPGVGGSYVVPARPAYCAGKLCERSARLEATHFPPPGLSSRFGRWSPVATVQRRPEWQRRPVRGRAPPALAHPLPRPDLGDICNLAGAGGGISFKIKLDFQGGVAPLDPCLWMASFGTENFYRGGLSKGGRQAPPLE